VPSLLEPPSDETLRLLRHVADGYLDAGGQWPVWQWVRARLDADGLDGEDVLRRLPTWQYGYQSVWFAKSAGQPPDLGDQVALRVHGLVHIHHLTMDQQLQAFLAALVEAQDRQASIVPMPTVCVGASRRWGQAGRAGGSAAARVRPGTRARVATTSRASAQPANDVMFKR